MWLLSNISTRNNYRIHQIWISEVEIVLATTPINVTGSDDVTWKIYAASSLTILGFKFQNKLNRLLTKRYFREIKMVKVSKQSTVITSHSKELRLPANVHKEERTTNLSILKFKHLTLLDVDGTSYKVLKLWSQLTSSDLWPP